MVRLSSVQKQADELSQEDRESLLAYLLHQLPSATSGPDDAEASARDAEMDSGEVSPISHEDFLKAAGFRS